MYCEFCRSVERLRNLPVDEYCATCAVVYICLCTVYDTMYNVLQYRVQYNFIRRKNVCYEYTTSMSCSRLYFFFTSRLLDATFSHAYSTRQYHSTLRALLAIDNKGFTSTTMNALSCAHLVPLPEEDNVDCNTISRRKVAAVRLASCLLTASNGATGKKCSLFFHWE